MYLQDYDFEGMFPQMPTSLRDEQHYKEDYHYIKQMYPGKLKLLAGIVEDYLEKFEYEGSPIYMEYPDPVSIYRIVCAIEKLFCKTGEEFEEKMDSERLRDLIYILVCQEIYIRRRRRERYLRRFRSW